MKTETPHTPPLRRTARTALLRAILIGWGSALLFAACSSRAGSQLADFNQPVYTPAYASGFRIDSATGAHSTLLRVTSPWQGAEGEESLLFIARNGEQPPAGFSGQVLSGAARRIVCLSSSHIAMLDALGEVERTVGVSGMDFIANAYVTAHRAEIADVGFDGSTDYEQLVGCAPDLVLLYGVNGANGMEPKLRELGIPYLYIGEYLEESPLGKAEWMVALAEVIGRRATGLQRFAEIPLRYNALKRQVAEEVHDAPAVMLNTPYGDNWFMPSTGSYLARLIADAGGDYLYRKNTGNTSMPIDLEEAYLLVSQADVWLNVGSAQSLDELQALCPKFTDTRCFRSGAVYNNNARTTAAGGNDFFESAVVHPDRVLRDLVKIFHPELVEADFVYYKPLK